MADASSSDTTSDCCNEWFSDITSEKSEYVIVGQKPCLSHRRSKRHFLQKLFLREIRGCLSAHNYASEERLFATVPSWRHLPLLHVIPKSALEAGHIVMGLTQCGQFLLTYTYTMDVSGTTSLYKYLLHWWAFTPNHVARKVAEVTLFGNYTIYRELSIVISQWPMERNKLVIHGLCTNWLHLQPTDRAYLTITTVPSLENCKDCLKVAASYEEEGEELAANWDGCVRCNCLQHGLTVHTTYEVISPYPRFRATVCLNYWNHVVVNTGNFLHVLRVDLDIPKSKNQKSNDKQDTVISDTMPLDMSDVEELDYTKTVERYEISDEKISTSECAAVDQSPRCELNIEHDFLEESIKLDKLGRDSLNTSSSNQSDCVCDINKSADVVGVKSCGCSDSSECKCRNSSPISRIEQQAISVRDKILQDFCEDMSQELNIDEAQETCEKLSSFRKRRLADKKYEFCDETEDAENIVPFKHIRDQFKHRGCSIYQISSSPTMSSVLPNGRKHWVDSDQSETDDINVNQENNISNELIIDSAEKNVLRPLNQNQLSNGGINRDRSNKYSINSSPLVPKINLQFPSIKCTAHFKRSYIELDDEMISVITDVEDEETGGYVSYQCVLPMHVHGSGYVQMQMISNSKAEKLIVPCVSINQLSFDIETFSHHIADWICMRFKKRYWHCSDYDIEIIDVCALSGDIICLLIMKIQASEISNQTQCSQERKQYEVGCKFTWNIDTSQYRITDILPLEEVKPESWKPNCMNVPNFRSPLWNPTRRLAPKLREKIQQPYAHTVRFLHNEMTLTGESITRLHDLDNLVEFYITPMPNYSSIE